MNTDPQYFRALARVERADDPVEEVRDIIEIYGDAIGDDDLQKLFEAPYEDVLFVYSDEKRERFFNFALEEAEVDGVMSRFNSYSNLMIVLKAMAISDFSPLTLSDDEAALADSSDPLMSALVLTGSSKKGLHRNLHVAFHNNFSKFLDDDARQAVIDYAFMTDDELTCEGPQKYSRLAQSLRPLLLTRKLRGRVKDRLDGFRDFDFV